MRSIVNNTKLVYHRTNAISCIKQKNRIFLEKAAFNKLAK